MWYSWSLLDGVGLIILGATTLDEEEVGWDEDDEDESDAEPKPASEPTIAPSTMAIENPIPKEDLLKPKSSIDRASQPDSESSYDVVSKAPSQAAGSPTVAKVDYSPIISHIIIVANEVSRWLTGVVMKRRVAMKERMET